MVSEKLKVAVIHYWFVTWRGGEKVVESILKLFPQADIYTLFYQPEVCGPYLQGKNIYTSSLDHPALRRHHRKLFPFYPKGIRSLHLQDKYDLIISSESGPAKGIANPSGIPHLCYTHTPMRYCWGYRQEYLRSLPRWSRSLANHQFEKLRQWDATTVDGVDLFVANSHNTAARIQRFYQRHAEICFPPISLDLFSGELVRAQKKHYLSFGAITPYKNIRLLVETFNQNGLPLVVIGEGSERKKLAAMAAKNIQFTGALPWSMIDQLISQSYALLFPGEEDFGMIPLEVMAKGVPVIAYKKGGALETVVENRQQVECSSGIFFEAATVESLASALADFEQLSADFDPQWIRNHARSFGEDHFQNRFADITAQLLNQQ